MTKTNMLQFFEAFLIKMKANFRRIAKATKHEMTVEDLQSDAWIVADEISKKRGRTIDFSDPADANLIMGAVDIRNVKRPEKHMQYAFRIDETREDDEGEMNSWANRLRADEASDPLISLLRRESAIDAEAMLAASYSQAAAYVMVFVHFKNNRKEVWAYLVISEGTLARRVTSAGDVVRVQPSLFDGIERIGKDFMPQRGRQYAKRAEPQYSGTQWEWEFEPCNGEGHHQQST